MMPTFNKFWRCLLILGALWLIILGPRPSKAEGTDKAPPRGSDSRQFLEELRSGGALKFYEDTEDILRAGKFERAYIRYIFLQAHIRGQALDAALVPMVEQRLHFLRGQMHLPEGFHFAGHDDTVKKRRPAKPACPPPPPKEAKKAEAEDKPPEIIIPPAPEDKPPPKEEAKTPSDEAPKPPPPPSTWEKLKGKLLFWRKGGG